MSHLRVINGGRSDFRLTEEAHKAYRKAKSRKHDSQCQSIVRLYELITAKRNTNVKAGPDLMENINYWKKHGTLPKCNMAKIMGQNDSKRLDTRRN